MSIGKLRQSQTRPRARAAGYVRVQRCAPLAMPSIGRTNISRADCHELRGNRCAWRSHIALPAFDDARLLDYHGVALGGGRTRLGSRDLASRAFRVLDLSHHIDGNGTAFRHAQDLPIGTAYVSENVVLFRIANAAAGG